MDYLIGLDIGTSAVKGVLLSTDGIIKCTDVKKYKYTVSGNRKTMEPSEFTGVCFDLIKSLAGAAEKDGRVVAICSCCASGNLILLDKNDIPVTPIIGWQTTVSKEDKNAFFSKEEQESFYNTVGWPLGSCLPALYLAYIKMHLPELLDKTQTVAMSCEYLNFLLTGEWGISHSMGTPFFLMDQAKGEYNLPLLQKLGIQDKYLPPIYSKGTVLGTVLPEMAEKTGLSPDTKVVLGSFDHPSGALGAGVFEKGQMLISCGTSWVEFFPADSREFAISTGGLVDRFMLTGSTYCVMKSLTSVSIKIDTLREKLLGKITHKEYDDFAVKSKLGCNGLRFNFDENDVAAAKGYAKSDIARAIIECAAYKLKENLSLLSESGLKAESITMIGGISNSLLCVKIISEVLGKEVKVVNGQSAGAVGSALLAGVGTGIYQNEKEAFNTLKFR